MGREARATAQLSPLERQERRLHRAARSVRHLAMLEDGLRGIPPGEQEAILLRIRPHLTFPVSEAEWRWLQRRLRLPEEAPGDITEGASGNAMTTQEIGLEEDGAGDAAPGSIGG